MSKKLSQEKIRRSFPPPLKTVYVLSFQAFVKRRNERGRRAVKKSGMRTHMYVKGSLGVVELSLSTGSETRDFTTDPLHVCEYELYMSQSSKETDEARLG